jgi:thymidylate synthase ThyX
MEIVDPRATIITETDPLRRIERCGRVCYRSEERIGPDTARPFVEMLVRLGHTSALEHARVVLDIRDRLALPDWSYTTYADMPYGIQQRSAVPGEHGLVAMNVRDYLAFGGTLDGLAGLRHATDYMTVEFVTDRAIANELVRHRVFSFSQESTRYCSYHRGVKFCRPTPFYPTRDIRHPRQEIWEAAMAEAERRYMDMLAEGAFPQEARNVLPLSTATVLIMTGTMRQWRAFLDLRTAPAAHPQMRYLATALDRQIGQTN